MGGGGDCLSFPLPTFPGCRQPLGFFVHRCVPPVVLPCMLAFCSICVLCWTGTPLSPHREDIFRKDYSQRSHLQVLGTNSSTDFWRQCSLTHSRAFVEALSARHASGPNGTSLLNLPKENYGALVCCPHFTDDNAAAERRSSLLGQGHAASK